MNLNLNLDSDQYRILVMAIYLYRDTESLHGRPRSAAAAEDLMDLITEAKDHKTLPDWGGGHSER